MPPLKIVSHRNNPHVSGWAALGLGLLCLALGQYSPAASSQAFWLKIGSGMFFLIGVGILVWSPRRTTVVDPGLEQVIVADRDRLKSSTRVIPFSTVAEVALREWEDPDPDIRPFKSIHYWLALRLTTGEEIEITDRQLRSDQFQQLKASILERLNR
jgi:hypothetical protein